MTRTLVVRDSMVLTDRHTRFVAITLVSSHDETAAALEQYFQRHGVPLAVMITPLTRRQGHCPRRVTAGQERTGARKDVSSHARGRT